MANYCYVLPILASGEHKMHSLIKDEITNNVNHDRFNQSSGVTPEQVWIQHTPMGDFAVIRYAVDDPARAFTELTHSTDPFAIKSRDFLREIQGVDFYQPMQMNERVLNWGA